MFFRISFKNAIASNLVAKTNAGFSGCQWVLLVDEMNRALALIKMYRTKAIYIFEPLNPIFIILHKIRVINLGIKNDILIKKKGMGHKKIREFLRLLVERYSWGWLRASSRARQRTTTGRALPHKTPHTILFIEKQKLI